MILSLSKKRIKELPRYDDFYYSKYNVYGCCGVSLSRWNNSIEITSANYSRTCLTIFLPREYEYLTKVSGIKNLSFPDQNFVRKIVNHYIGEYNHREIPRSPYEIQYGADPSTVTRAAVKKLLNGKKFTTSLQEDYEQLISQCERRVIKSS